MEDWFLFGTIILESVLDMEPLVAYQTYDCRWEIELVIRYYKQTCEFDETRVHDDYSVIGSEFFIFLSTIITYRMLDAFEKSGLFHKMTRAKKVRIDGANWELITMNPSQIEILQTLELLPKPTLDKRGWKQKPGIVPLTGKVVIIIHYLSFWKKGSAASAGRNHAHL